MAKRLKPQIEIRGLSAGPSEMLRPIVLGNFDVEWDLEDFQPCIVQGALKVLQLAAQDWKGIEQEISRPIDEHHREWIDYACSSFAFAVMHRGEIPSAKQYHKQLSDHAGAMEKVAKALLLGLTVNMEDGRVRTYGKVSTAQDHVAAYGMTYWQNEIIGAVELAKRLGEFRKLVEQEIPTTNKGRDSHYELHNFFHTLYLIAQSLKLETSISSRRTRETDELKKPTTFERFARAILQALRDKEARILATYELSAQQRQRAQKLFRLYTTKPDIIDDLMEARRRSESDKPRTKKWAKNSNK